MLSDYYHNDLAMTLFAGLTGDDPWRPFLHQLMAHTQAEKICLVIEQRHMLSTTVRVVASGFESDEIAEQQAISAWVEGGLRPNRIYALEELPTSTGTDGLLARAAIGDARLVRTTIADAGSVQLALLHQRQIFDARDSALLTALLPAIRIAAANVFDFDRCRTRRDVAEQALRQLGVAQAVLNAQGEIIAADALWQEADPATHDLKAIAKRSTAEHFSYVHNKSGEPIFLRSIGPGELNGLAQPGVIVSMRKPWVMPLDRAEPVLTAIFGLSPREAALAARLAAGLSLNDAGTSMGLSPETTRNYSKRIFAKTQTSGQVDLVRRILSSLAVLC